MAVKRNNEMMVNNLLIELLDKKVITEEQEEETRQILNRYIPAQVVIQPQPLTAEMEFLNNSLKQNVESYFDQSVMPTIKTYLAGTCKYGRLLNDEDVRAASEKICVSVLQEIGRPYEVRLLRIYFGNRESLISWLLKRIRDMIFKLVSDENDRILVKNSLTK